MRGTTQIVKTGKDEKKVFEEKKTKQNGLIKMEKYTTAY